MFGAKVCREGGWERGNAQINARLGLEDSACRVAILSVGGRYLEFFEFDVPEQEDKAPVQAHQYGIAHICLQVSDCQAEYERLSKSGMNFNASPLEMPAGAIFTYGRDPDGNIIEILEVPEGCAFPKVLG